MNFRIILLLIIIITIFNGCLIFSDINKNEEDLFKSGKNYYYSSINFDLDKTKTCVAINKINQFIREYPNSCNVKEAYRLLNDLLKKIEDKNYNIADSYFLMGRYQVSLIYFKNLIKNFPDGFFKEQILYKICLSQYKLSKKKDFFRSYEEYMKYFSHLSNAKKLKFLYKKLKNI
ncbi:outer membrane protein assembly factor BamD [Blattabacterium cuenoti]|uniref:outer membrane protein assembly factor BamD n=1 Tax=Blattabacterium cuenoti TaxID=1653831 RepID=UPI00163C8D94|nr:outer membrane protein assembly factor BamD [Blattabacterium cuenoti]